MIFISPVANAKYYDNCKGALPISEQSFYGNWIESKGKTTSFVSYDPNKTFSGRIEIENKSVWEFKGKWYLIDNIKYMIYTYSSLKEIPIGYEDSDEILEITCDEYKFRNKSGRLGIVKRENT